MDNILFRKSWFKTLKRYTPEMVVDFLNALEDYNNGKPVNITNDRVMDLWEQAEPLLNADKNKYDTIVERNRENGKKGGRPSKNPHNPVEPKITQENQVGFLETQHNPENLKDKDKDNEKDKDKLYPSDKAYMEIGGGTTPDGLSPTSPIPDIKDGGWERVYSLFPESKRRDCKNALIVWSGLPQSEKKQVIRHLSIYVKNTELKFIKQINNYFNEGLWKKMKPEGSTKNEIGTVGNTGFISYNLIKFWEEINEFNNWEEAYSDFVKLDEGSKKLIVKEYQNEIQQRKNVK